VAGKTHLLGEVKWSSRQPIARGLLRTHAQLVAKSLPPFARGKVVHALFVPMLPRTRPRGLPADVRLIDAAAVIAALGPG
jgi:hypothetical protein